MRSQFGFGLDDLLDARELSPISGLSVRPNGDVWAMRQRETAREGSTCSTRGAAISGYRRRWNPKPGKPDENQCV